MDAGVLVSFVEGVIIWLNQEAVVTYHLGHE
jgi:hypothetical protein